MKRTYIQLSRAWYAKTILAGYAKKVIPITERISIMAGGWKFSISWHTLIEESVPRLEAFDDAWGILVNDCADLLKELALLADATPSPGRIVKVLEKLGFEDETQEEE